MNMLITKDKVLRAAEENPCVKGVLQSLFPEAFKKTYWEEQEEWVKSNGIGVGSMVKVLRENTTLEEKKFWGFDQKYGNCNYYCTEGLIKEYFTIINIDGDGIRLNNYHYYPYFVLSPIKEKYADVENCSDVCVGRNSVPEELYGKCLLLSNNYTWELHENISTDIERSTVLVGIKK
jgi:hypothetical protein